MKNTKPPEQLKRNCIHVLLDDADTITLGLAAEAMGLQHSSMARLYILRGLVADQFKQHPLAKYQQSKAG